MTEFVKLHVTQYSFPAVSRLKPFLQNIVICMGLGGKSDLSLLMVTFTFEIPQLNLSLQACFHLCVRGIGSKKKKKSLHLGFYMQVGDSAVQLELFG